MKCARNSFLPLLPDFPARRVLPISSPLLLSADLHRLWVNGWAEHPEDTVKLLCGTAWFTGSSTHGLSYRSVLSVECRGCECEETANVSPGLEMRFEAAAPSEEPHQQLRKREREEKKNTAAAATTSASSDLVRVSVHLIELQIIIIFFPPQRHRLRQTKCFRQDF